MLKLAWRKHFVVVVVFDFVLWFKPWKIIILLCDVMYAINTRTLQRKDLQILRKKIFRIFLSKDIISSYMRMCNLSCEL